MIVTCVKCNNYQVQIFFLLWDKLTVIFSITKQRTRAVDTNCLAHCNEKCGPMDWNLNWFALNATLQTAGFHERWTCSGGTCWRVIIFQRHQKWCFFLFVYLFWGFFLSVSWLIVNRKVQKGFLLMYFKNCKVTRELTLFPLVCCTLYWLPSCCSCINYWKFLQQTAC